MNYQNENEIKYYILKMDFVKINKILNKIQKHICLNYKVLIYSLSENLLLLENIIEKMLLLYNLKVRELNIDKIENNLKIEKI